VRRDGGSTEAVSETLDEHVRYDEFNVASGFARYVAAGIKVIEERGATVPPLHLLVTSDIPVGAGLSSSASLEVALIRVIDRLLGLGLGRVDVALLAHRAEVVHVGVLCGIMDQMASSIAAPDRMLLLDTRSMAYELRPLPAGAEILVIDSGTRRSLLTSGYNTRIEECRQAAAALGVRTLREVEDPAAVEQLPEPLRRRARYVLAENARVTAAATASAPEFGRLMGLSHAGLRDEFEVVAPAVDTLVRTLAAEPGVLGARMTGAGFGGACVALVEAGRAAEIGQRVVAAAGVPGAAVLIPGATVATSPRA
jgi:galactokinase